MYFSATVRTSLSGYHELISRCRDDGIRGGVGLYLKSMIHFNIREDISVFIPHVCESLFVEIINNNGRNVVVGVVYRPNTEPHADVDIFASNMEHIMDTIQHENKLGLIMGDMNIDLLKFEMHPKTDDYLEKLFSQGFLPVITKPTRVTTHSATLPTTYRRHITLVSSLMMWRTTSVLFVFFVAN